MGDPVVIGIDVGTTRAKALAVDATGRAWGDGAAACELYSPAPGIAVQDWRQLRAAAVRAIRAAAREAMARGAQVVGISVATAMHALTAIDASGEPLTPLITWADTRAWTQAERLASGRGNLSRQRRTGVPAHSMTPLAKLVWLRSHEPEMYHAARRWVGIKELMLAFLTGAWVIDYSCAGGTGLFNFRTLDWDGEALDLTGLEPTQLCQVVPTTAVAGGLSAAAAAELGVSPSLPVVAGAGDGPLANLGVGAVSPGVAVVSIGTSGAVRVTVRQPAVDKRAALFCYALTDELWTVGGAINNGGAAFDWLARTLVPHLTDDRRYELFDEAAAVPAGSEGLIMLPYLLGERAPYWDAQARAAFVGLSYRHSRPHLVRATVEGVCQQLALVLDSIRDAGHGIREIRATGGFVRSDLWRQVLADAFGRPIGFPQTDGGSSYGAAVLGLEALAMIDSFEPVTHSMEMQEIREPDERSSNALRAVRPTFVSLYYALRPAFRELQSERDAGSGGMASTLARAEPEHARRKSTWDGTQ